MCQVESSLILLSDFPCGIYPYGWWTTPLHVLILIKSEYQDFDLHNSFL